MRWPLRNQILLPMLAITLATLLVVTVINAYVSVSRTRERIERELREVTATLADASFFPLTNSDILQKMRGLSGAEFIFCDDRNAILAASSEDADISSLPTREELLDSQPLALVKPITVSGQRFFHSGLALRRISSAGRPTALHVLYPEASYREEWRHAAYPPILAGAAAIIPVVLLGLGIASRVTRPLRRLRGQVDRIAEGDFQSFSVPRRQDEIADLSRAVNRMAQMLTSYENQVRSNERLRTLGQLGGGIAHQIRNSVTGCRLAIELHARNCPLQDDSETMDVATRQLELMETFLQRFLSLGSRRRQPHEPVDLGLVITSVASLVKPTAEHVGVQLDYNVPEKPLILQGDQGGLEQMLVNLALNAIEAASSKAVETSGAETKATPTVRLAAAKTDTRVVIEVQDTGTGPATNVAEQLFEPFVTDKPDGTGLGLSVAQEIAAAHGGSIRWRRQEGMTCFTVELPPVAE